jgi:metal-sulfur cluster biosynthetic enzyme
MSDGDPAGGGPGASNGDESADDLAGVDTTVAAVDDPDTSGDGETPADQLGEVPAEAAGYCAYTEYEWGEAAEDLPATGEGATGAAANVWDALYGVEDPEMPVSIVDLGLVYGVHVDDGHATVVMTLTYTGCPARDMLLSAVESAATCADGVDDADVELVWSPEWNLEMVTEAGREDLREFGVSV